MIKVSAGKRVWFKVSFLKIAINRELVSNWLQQNLTGGSLLTSKSLCHALSGFCERKSNSPLLNYQQIGRNLLLFLM